MNEAKVFFFGTARDQYASRPTHPIDSPLLDVLRNTHFGGSSNDRQARGGGPGETLEVTCRDRAEAIPCFFEEGGRWL